MSILLWILVVWLLIINMYIIYNAWIRYSGYFRLFIAPIVLLIRDCSHSHRKCFNLFLIYHIIMCRYTKTRHIYVRFSFFFLDIMTLFQKYTARLWSCRYTKIVCIHIIYNIETQNKTGEKYLYFNLILL